jgi:hypothetical protein
VVFKGLSSLVAMAASWSTEACVASVVVGSGAEGVDVVFAGLDWWPSSSSSRSIDSSHETSSSAEPELLAPSGLRA